MIDLFLKGGPLMWPILLCSIIALAITINKSWQYREILKEISRPREDLQANGVKSFPLLLEAIENGLDDRQISLLGTRKLKSLGKGLGSLSLISVITPLLGLTGTVLGMIKAFRVIANQHSCVDPGMLAGGIWEALITTAAGLLVAIPAHVAYHYLDGCLDEIALRIKELAISLYEKRQ